MHEAYLFRISILILLLLVEEKEKRELVNGKRAFNKGETTFKNYLQKFKSSLRLYQRLFGVIFPFIITALLLLSILHHKRH